jgi:hypothetical protein
MKVRNGCAVVIETCAQEFTDASTARAEVPAGKEPEDGVSSSSRSKAAEYGIFR